MAKNPFIENSIAAVCKGYDHNYNQKWTFINKNGIEIIDWSFPGYRNLKNGFIEIESYGAYIDKYETGLMAISGSFLFEPQESAHYYFSEKFIKAPDGYYLLDGTEIKNENLKYYQYIGHIRENRGIAQLKESQEYVIIDNEFNLIKNLKITDSNHLGETYGIIQHVYGCYFYGKVCPIKKNNKWGLIDFNGDFVLNPKYDFIGGFTDIKMWDSFSYGCAGVGKEINSEMKYSAINSDFQEISDFIFDEIRLFDEDIANVRIGEKWGAINSKGEIIVPIEFNSIYDCYKGLIKVAYGDYEGRRFFGKYGLFNKKGIKLTKYIYEELYVLENGYVKFEKDNKWGILNNEGKEAVRNIYNEIKYVNHELLLVEIDNEKFYISFTGREFRQKS